jgi:membrane-associated protein
VVTPFLPGDSLLFAAGAIAGGGGLNTPLLVAILLAAAILGDTVNYTIGKFAGEKILSRFPHLVKPEHLERTYRFFERYGAKTIILCRFVPIVRTLAPFVAGAGTMSYPRFMRSNIIGAIIWVSLFVFAGYFFGKIPFVIENFTLVLLVVIVLSFLPAVVEFLRERRRSRRSLQTER